ncbi:hypothetical protein CDD80_3116 [Ophiocordyceps camponoti-rufipedis]|uniref:DNL-type domain-containing protein n=1 Tax=Ophiocordyceps camponoti-rufipedis TaxID=2004952 RepID=A0A2C5XJ79_9HYPO|nr:hypothetical protein CDD80_3116 [Ophiocordyceps camponoti-rufipedis]
MPRIPASRLPSRPSSLLFSTLVNFPSPRPRLPLPILARPHTASITTRPRFTIPRPRRTSDTQLAPQPDQEALDGTDDALPEDQETIPSRDRPDPAYYQLSFTCIPCDHRSQHSVSKHGYHYGSVLITCPGCRNRHVISDHLKIFGDRDVTVEDLMRERGRLVKRGSLGEDSNVEFWPEEVASSQTPPSTTPTSQPPGHGQTS